MKTTINILADAFLHAAGDHLRVDTPTGVAQWWCVAEDGSCQPLSCSDLYFLFLRCTKHAIPGLVPGSSHFVKAIKIAQSRVGLLSFDEWNYAHSAPASWRLPLEVLAA